MHYTIKTMFAVICLLFTGAPALADEVVISYRSGAVQQIPLLEPTEQIQQISYRKKDTVQAPATAATQVAAPQQQPTTSTHTSKTAAPAAPEPKPEEEKKIPIKLKWAQPKDSW